MAMQSWTKVFKRPRLSEGVVVRVCMRVCLRGCVHVPTQAHSCGRTGGVCGVQIRFHINTYTCTQNTHENIHMYP